MSPRRNGYQSDDDNIKYKINTRYFTGKSSPKKQEQPTKKHEQPTKKHELKNEDTDTRYMFPTVLIKPLDRKIKPKPKIKVNFWSNKQQPSRLHESAVNKEKNIRRHTIATTQNTTVAKPKTSIVKVRKQVSFLPSPLFSENHVPMVTVPDDLTIQLNEEEANDLGEDLNLAFANSINSNERNDVTKRKARSSMTQTSPRGTKRNRSTEDTGSIIQCSDNELEFFSKYVVQKLRRMETNQRIYSENLINTVLMLGQLGKLNGKSKIGDA